VINYTKYYALCNFIRSWNDNDPPFLAASLVKSIPSLFSIPIRFKSPLDAPTTEAVTSELVSNKSIYARIDRPSGIVVFGKPRPAADVLSEWSRDLETVLTLVETTTHLIHKEYMETEISDFIDSILHHFNFKRINFDQ
jgi:hypothetical protein